jgi:type I restriction enzyme, S subunit
MTEDKDFKEFENLPEGWRRVRLGEVGKIIDGDWILERYYAESGVRLIQVGDIGIGKLLIKSNHYISDKSARHLKVKFLKEGQILISRLPDPIGRSCLVPKLPYPAITAVDVSILTVYEEIAEKIFIVQILNTDLFFVQCLNLASGTTRFRISRSNLENILLPLPPLPEQRKIVEILETVDNAIEKTEKIIEKYKRIKQGLVQDLLTKGIDEKGNIRSEKTHKFKDSPLGRIPEEWEVVRLGEVVDIKGGKRLPKGEELVDEGYPYIRLSDIKDMKIQIDKVKFITENVRKKISKYTVSKNDVIISIAGTIGLVALIPDDLDNANLTENAVKLTSLLKINRLYLAYSLLSFSLQKQINEMVGIVAQPKLAIFRLATLFLPLPPLPEQQKIAEILSQIDQAIEKEEKYKEKLERLKQGLMQDLLTGKVRVNHLIEEGAENVST